MKDFAHIPAAPLRPPSEVMRLRRMGAMFPTRLSFLRAIIRSLSDSGSPVTRPVWDISDEGYGRAVYSVTLAGHVYSLVAISTHLPDHLRSDRVIAEAWDASFVLYDGVPDTDEIDRIAAAAPRQEAARFTERDLVLSRANRSVRLWDHVVAALREGRQPDADLIHQVGYLMRTTAVYGNGKFGIADRKQISARPVMQRPFAAEMLTVWLIRGFTHDLAEHLGGTPIASDLKRHLGIGNATGLGMAPFLVSHPVLLHNWMAARETALARVLALPSWPGGVPARLGALATRAGQHLQGWNVPDPEASARIDKTRAEWPMVQTWLAEAQSPAELWDKAGALAVETQELLAALMLEPMGDLIDDLVETMHDSGAASCLPPETFDALRGAIETHFGWALALDFDQPDTCRRFWYVSEEKQEPRLGDRHAEPGADRESPLDVARRVQALYRALPPTGDLRTFRAHHPEHEMAVRRVSTVASFPYSEIRDNLIAAGTRPIDMLRCKLAFFGATRFDPKSDLWTRVTLAQGAPLFDDIAHPDADDWWLPVQPS